MTSQTKTKKTSHQNEINHFVLETTKKKSKMLQTEKKPTSNIRKEREQRNEEAKNCISIFWAAVFCVCLWKKNKFHFPNNKNIQLQRTRHTKF